MRLLYCYVQFLNENGETSTYRGLDHLEFNFSTGGRCSFDSLTNTLRWKKRGSPLPEHFWDAGFSSGSTRIDNESVETNIYNVNVISGENGSGKTTAMHYLIDLLDGLYAAAEPIVDDRDRMEKLDIAGNRSLLLFEDDGVQYLLDYVPAKAEALRGLRREGFPQGFPKPYVFSSWRDFAHEPDVVGQEIANLLRKTKVIYLTNTLNQHDYERHVGERNERLRDFFVYDVSIGAPVGPDIAQFFPYEVYKQVKYVFDKNQAAKRLALESRVQKLRLPNALRLHLRMELAWNAFALKHSNVSLDQLKFSSLLGLLCVVAFGENLCILTDDVFKPVYRAELLPQQANSSIVDCIALLRDLKVQFIEAASFHALNGHVGWVLCITVLPDGRVVSGSDDGTLRVWDPSTGECLRAFGVPGGAVRCVAAMPDGRVVSGSRDGTLRVWFGTAREESGSTIDTAKQLWQACKDYIEFLEDRNESLFSRFTRIDAQTYELSLETIKKHYKAIGGDKEENRDTLYADLIEFIQKYRSTCKPTYTIDFDWGLSSGEENMLRIFSNLYHIFDRNYSTGEHGDYSIYNNEGHSDDDSQKTKCDSVLLFMDEADLTLHPEWQRRLISILTAFIPQIYPVSCVKDIQLILSTHSPLILGDIPNESITYLPRKGEGTQKSEEAVRRVPDGGFETFGQNIHTILKDSFFLEHGTIGDFAGRKINGLAGRLQQIRDRADAEAFPNVSVAGELREELLKAKGVIRIVAPGVLRTKLHMLYRDADAAVSRLQRAAKPAPDAEELLSIAQGLSKRDRLWLMAELERRRGSDD